MQSLINVKRGIPIVGGTSLLPQMRERMEKDLGEAAPQAAKVKVIVPSNPVERRYSVWIGIPYESSLISFAILMWDNVPSCLSHAHPESVSISRRISSGRGHPPPPPPSPPLQQYTLFQLGHGFYQSLSSGKFKVRPGCLSFGLRSG